MIRAPKVSVIMPVYNGERFIAEAIESVLAQDFQHWELIVINDGSTDETAKVLAGFVDPRVRIIHQANGGEAAARNRGLEAVSGEYVGFLDADDLYLPEALGHMVAFLDTHTQADALFSDGYFCDEDNRPIGRLSEVRPGPFTGCILEPLVLDPSVIAGIICTLTRRATIASTGVRFDTTLVIGPDWDFWIQFARRARFGYLDRPTCMYRIHHSNISLTSGSARRRLDLVHGRQKVMNADWFAELSLPTREAFFRDLLINLLKGLPDQQRAIMDGGPFQALPSNIKARLFRQVAGGHLSKRQDMAFALDCLTKALILEPGNMKAQVMYQLGARSPKFAVVALAGWHKAHRAAVRLLAFGKRKPRPVPTALLPKTE
jgi:glycosyltransferase involved in cell wall biosynthesis